MEMFVKGILIEVLAAVGESVGAVLFPPFPASMGGDSALFLFPGDAGVGADVAITGTKPAGMWWVEPGGMVNIPPCCCGDSMLPVVIAVVVCGGIAVAMGTGIGIEIVLL
jgi:hypothetical protein